MKDGLILIRCDPPTYWNENEASADPISDKIDRKSLCWLFQNNQPL
jgi:hypothetical protein